MRFLRQFSIEVKRVADFDSLLATGDHLVDFHATWCGPCKVLAPILDKVTAATTSPSTLARSVIKVDIDILGELAERYRISSVPTVILFRNGKPIKQFIGVRDEAFLKEFIKLDS